jgi:hypothetical protein
VSACNSIPKKMLLGKINLKSNECKTKYTTTQIMAATMLT